MTIHAQRRGFPIVALVGLVWLACGAGDWFMRFHWYRWQATLVAGPAVETVGPFASMRTIEVPVRRGGDLSHLLGIPKVAALFEDERPAMIETSDEFGYRNHPPTATNNYSVVVTGSSFMNSGYPMTNILASRLSRQLGVPVYNAAFPGRGPFIGLIRFLQDERFVRNPPRVLVWGVVEREIGAHAFGGLLYQIELLVKHTIEARKQDSSILWRNLRPGSLKTALPDSSAIAQLSRRIWTFIRYYVFGRMNPAVAASGPSWKGAPFLFYSAAVESLRWMPAQRIVPSVADDIAIVSDYLRARGIALVMLLIPDKEQVYREFLPGVMLDEANPIPPSCLDELGERLRVKDVPVVSLLGPYREGAGQGRLLYWRDDTHWNSEAIAMAAEAVSHVVEPLLAAQPAAPGSGAF
ncbi:MAG: hypothetical protein V1929_05295 [bacterium]